MNILFAMFDGGGNVPPQLAVARALRARGAKIHFLGHIGLRERVEAEGFSFEPFAQGRHFNPTTARSLPAIMADFARVASDPASVMQPLTPRAVNAPMPLSSIRSSLPAPLRS